MSELHGHTRPQDGNTVPTSDNQSPEQCPDDMKRHKHTVRPAWLRLLLKTMAGILVFILLLPVLVYIPFVQDLLKDVACRIASQATGMTVRVEKFRLKFPLDVQLDGLLVLTERGDTMVQARSLLADVKMLPLLSLDAEINRVSLKDGKYFMASEDSSMTMRISAGQLDFEHGSDLNLKRSHISLRRPVLRDADISLCLDVWKQKPDSVKPPTEWIIAADRLLLENVRYSMSMLPTVKELEVRIGNGRLTGALIDLKHYEIRAHEVNIDKGRARYIVPTAQFIASHPVPPDTISTPSPPYTIRIGKAALNFDYALYATDSVTPAPGFDPAYIEASDMKLVAEHFYNRSSTLSLPLKSIQAKERSGLCITSGTGTVDIDSIGIRLSALEINTPHSSVQGDALISYGLMALDPDAPVHVKAHGSLGRADLYAYSPTLKPLFGKLPNHGPITFNADLSGTVSALDIAALDVRIRRFLTLKASGRVYNPLNPDKLQASLYIDGSLQDAGVANSLFGPQLAAIGLHIPTFSIKGHATVDKQYYKADLALKSSAGDASATGQLHMRPERYDADITLSHFDISSIMPSLGIGVVSGSLSAHGAGFNPTKSAARSSIKADAATLVYGNYDLAPFTLEASLGEGDFEIDLQGTNPDIDLALAASGHVSGNDLTADMQADIRRLDLNKPGFMDKRCAGAATFALSGTANMQTLHCDLEASLYNLDWDYDGTLYTIPEALDALLASSADRTRLDIYGEGLNVNLDASAPLKSLMSDIPEAIDLILTQVEKRNMDMHSIASALPTFTLGLDLESAGLASHFLKDTDYNFSALHLSMQNDSTLSGNVRLCGAGNSSLTLDTVTLAMSQRGRMLDYKAHIGNTATNLPAFAAVDVRGYVGANRASAFLRQHDSSGREGYRLGLTAAMGDSAINIHLTPLDAIIAYKPWVINDDNFVQLGPGSRIQADLTASGAKSSIHLHTPVRPDSLQSLQVQINNLYIEDFLQMSALAPPVSGIVNSDLTFVYRGKGISGSGYLGIKDLAYERRRIGDLDFDIKGGMGFTGNSGGKIGMLFNGKEVMALRGYMITDSVAMARRIKGTPTAFELELKEFPLAIANPFLPQDYMQLTGAVSGKMKMTGEFTSPLLNGSLKCDSAGISIPTAGSTIRLDRDNPVIVDHNVLHFNKFGFYGANNKPVLLNGKVDATNISDISVDLTLNGKDVAIVDHKRKSSDIYGKLFVDLNAKAHGRLKRLDINADLSVLPATDIYYSMATAATAIQTGNTTDVVKFVQFSDSTATVPADTAAVTPAMNMRVNATLGIISGAKATVILSANGTDKVSLSPYGNLSYTQNFMGDMRLNGSIFIADGVARYSVPMIGEKSFTFDEGSYINWSGELMNPSLHIYATDRVKANVQQEGVNSRLINFDVGLSVLGSLSAPKVAFDLSTGEDMTVSNELQSMTAEQRSASAMNLLLYGSYTGPGVKANANLSNPLYSFLEGQLNSWAAKNIRGVDLSFGIDNYDKTINGQQNNTTSYSYQVSKSLFDNRFKIIVGGNYSTDAQADENFVQSLISDISFEYSLRQSANMSMYLRLFRHTGFESILEGEVTETGVGFVMRRKLSNLRSLFRFGRRKHKELQDSLSTDSLPLPPQESVPLSGDSIINYETPEAL